MGVKIGGKMVGDGSTTVEHKEGDSEIVHEAPEYVSQIGNTIEPVAEVMWGAGITIPTQPYASVRLDCRITMPAPVGEIDAVFEFCQNWVDERLGVGIENVKATYGLK